MEKEVKIPESRLMELLVTEQEYELQNSACHLNGAALAIKKERDDLKTEVEKLRAGRDARQKERDECREKNKALKARICELEHELLWRANRPGEALLTKQIVELEATSKNQYEQYRRLEQGYSALKTERDSLLEKIEQQKGVIISLNAKVDERDEAIRELKTNVDALMK